ncbi:hypothetical protein H8356DRAFT_1672087 [Neocallimastix lanati (nom. inval.)]|nr:hypothetical protein H8356DRAFT_1672087 [Neocallimastix sp. JGI-2020a]
MDQSFKDFNPPMSSISNNFSFLHSTIDDKVLNNSLSINNNNVIVEDMSMNSEDITNSVLYNNYYSYSSNSNNNNNNNNYNNNKNDFNKHSSVSHPPRDSSLSAIKPRRSYDKNYNKYNYNQSYSSSYGSNDNSYQYNHSLICKSNSYQHNNNMEHDYLKIVLSKRPTRISSLFMKGMELDSPQVMFQLLNNSIILDNYEKNKTFFK